VKVTVPDVDARTFVSASYLNKKKTINIINLGAFYKYVKGVFSFNVESHPSLRALDSRRPGAPACVRACVCMCVRERGRERECVCV